MSDRKAFEDPNQMPEDIASRFPWTNLYNTKSRDFFASRTHAREEKLQQQAIPSERGVRVLAQTSEADRAGTVPQASGPKSLMSNDQGETGNGNLNPQSQGPSQPIASQQPPQRGRDSAWSPTSSGRSELASQGVSAHSRGGDASPNSQRQYPNKADFVPAPPEVSPAVREQNGTARRAWSRAEQRDAATRPAWLASDRVAMPQPQVHQAPEDTLQGSRDRLTSRWFALKGVFSGVSSTATEQAGPAPSRPPVLAVFSLAGGVGKTSLVATLGRTLSARGERVLLVDTAAFGLLPFFFGARDQRPGVLRTFTAPGNSADAPVQLITVDCDSLSPENVPQETLSAEITRHSYGASRVLVDLGTASGAITRRVLRLNPTVLVPVLPDLSSVVSVSAIDAFFQRNSMAAGTSPMPFYMLNQFDPSLPLHLDLKEVLREQLGERLLPFSLRRTPAVGEALAEGMTVVDYAPHSPANEDFNALANWVKSLAAPATTGFRGVRWSER